MDIKIITIHAMYNPGSVFQAYALQKYLQKDNKDNNVQIIDYRPNYFYTEGSWLKLIGKKILFGKDFRNRDYKFNNFIESHMDLTEKVKSESDLEKAHFKGDVFIAGSDQLWNTDYKCGHDMAFYLHFVEDGEKISYSTSVGKKVIDNENMTILKRELPAFRHIAVREKSTAGILSKELNRKVEWVCDPVFLLNKEDYMPFIKKQPWMDKDYVMIYIPPLKSRLISELVKYYKNKGLRVVLCGGFTKRCECDQMVRDMGPEDFLSIIYYSKAVVCGSFHATAFSLIMHKNFVSVVPKPNGERILSLLEEAGLKERAMDDMLYEDILEKKIDWNHVDENLLNYINSSKNYLQSVLDYK
ncbi:polysaccharide pyruvyl transferase family protein [uncultured Dialister sp.]|uniref:polysaccharide pyruvyl transferase family protein n=1 Tax=uncultured Dialister sp. TaxID=278064 RepID=UPI0025F046FC|nr:polysaccharide pyruvyl transferase family protein [uncultured Dialister sp.]